MSVTVAKFAARPILVSIALAIASSTLAGCGGEKDAGNTKPALVAIDTSTPDRAIKSFWAATDAHRAWEKAQRDKDRAAYPLPRSQLDLVTQRFAANRPELLDVMDRSITDVSVQSGSRAVVTAQLKNATPISAEAATAGWAMKQRETGEQVRYVLEKTPSGWRIDEVWTFDRLLDKGWTRSWPAQDPRPAPPWLTYPY